MATLAACSGSSSASSKSSTWCVLQLGATREQASAAMGAPHGSKASSYSKYPRPGIFWLEWDEGASVFVATFDATGHAVKLLAYDRVIGPDGAHGLSCKPFRSASVGTGQD